MRRYRRLRFSLPHELEERFTAELWSRGPLGCELRPLTADRILVDAYFVAGPPAAASFELGPWAARGVRLESADTLPEQDWLASYRAAARPFDVGRRLRIDPRDPEPAGVDPAPAGRQLLRIPAQTAFGTGEHESTRLVLEWLEDLAEEVDLGALRVLDVGSGSGILSFAAALWGARRIVGYDVDLPAAWIARRNARLNALDTPRFFTGRAAALAAVPRFDLALVNVLPERIETDVPLIRRALAPRARVLSSGNLAERRDELVTRWQGWGFELEAERTAGEWLAFLLRRRR